MKVFIVTAEYLEPAGAMFKLLANSEEEAVTIISAQGASIPGFKIVEVTESEESDLFDFNDNEVIPSKENMN